MMTLRQQYEKCGGEYAYGSAMDTELGEVYLYILTFKDLRAQPVLSLKAFDVDRAFRKLNGDVRRVAVNGSLPLDYLQGVKMEKGLKAIFTKYGKHFSRAGYDELTEHLTSLRLWLNMNPSDPK